MTFYFPHSGQEHEYTEIHELLTTRLLEEDARAYLFLLVTAADNEVYIADVLNDTSATSTWFSSHAMCLAYIVGSVTDHAKSMRTSDIPFYGRDLSEGPSDEVGCDILNIMLMVGADLTLKNYYDESIVDVLRQDDKITSREKNDEFKQLVIEHYGQDSH
jgi:hypothetical protein